MSAHPSLASGLFALSLGVLLSYSSASAQEAAATSGDPDRHEDWEYAIPGDVLARAPDRPIPMFDVVRAALEPAYLAYPVGLSGLDKLIFESNIVAHFVLHRPRWLFALVLSPKIVVRMFQGNSTPVKSPSYMPRITAFIWFQQTVHHTPTLYASLMLSHHSNGQALSFLDDTGAIRHEGGSFSTNYLEASLYATGASGRWFGWSSLSFEWHPGIDMDPELRGRYGLMRLHLASTVVTDLPLAGQLHVRLSAILDRFTHTGTNDFMRQLERFPISVRYTIQPPGMELGLYVGYLVGHDYYNIYFDKIVHTIQVGISGAVAPSLVERD
jgi:hypothetical protein